MAEQSLNAKKVLRKIALAMKTSLKVWNRTQYTNHQMNNAVLN